MNKHMRRATFLLEKHKLTKHLSSLVWQCCVAADSWLQSFVLAASEASVDHAHARGIVSPSVISQN
jgi:hypothetical protein